MSGAGPERAAAPRWLAGLGPRVRAGVLALRRRTLAIAATVAAAVAGVGFLLLAADRGLARAMAPELAAVALGAALLLGAGIAWALLRAPRAARAPAAPDGAEDVATAVAGLLAERGGGAAAALVAGLLCGARARGGPGPGRGRPAAGNGRA